MKHGHHFASVSTTACKQQNLGRSMYFFENGRFEIFTSKDILKPYVLQPNVLKK
jgi:hypothetical protein